MIEIIGDAQIAAVRRWKHFDAEWYLREYPDVEWAGLDPAYHYLWIGAQIGRKPSLDFAHFSDNYRGIDDLIQRINGGDFSCLSPVGCVREQAVEFVDPIGIDVADVRNFSVAVHAHMYYVDLADEFAQYLRKMPCSFDLYASTANEQDREFVEKVFLTIPNVGCVDVRVVPNIGRDIAPFVVEFGKDMAKYDVISHIQTKKTLHNSEAYDWSKYLLDALFGESGRIAFFLRELKAGRYGIVYPQYFYKLPYASNTWLANEEIAKSWASRFGVEDLPKGYLDFPAGSMFWACTDALRPLLEAGLDWGDFPPEQGQTDGTLAHCIERMLGVVPMSRDFQLGVIRDTRTPSWSRWRFNQFTGRSFDHLHAMIADDGVKVVAFDIFDTLLTRPFLSGDYVKDLLDTEYEQNGLMGFGRLRTHSVDWAREAKGSEVDIYDIYRQISVAPEKEFASLTPNREIELEIKAVRPRRDVVALLKFAVKSGKRVILIGDTHLARVVVVDMLARCGIRDWNDLYLSSEVGLRKADGRLYEYILNNEGVSPNQMVMVGDDEQLDLHVPCWRMGIRSMHIIKPVDIMRAMPRLSDLVPSPGAASADEQFLFGAIASENFGLVSYPDFSPGNMFGSTARSIGYSLLGPILVVFSQWLLDQAREKKLDRFYFLAHRGDLLKRALDCWQIAQADVVHSESLPISRRALEVSCIRTVEDIFDIAASSNFYDAPMAAFLNEKFGTALDDRQWEMCEHEKIWSRTETLTIIDHDIEHIRSFLQFSAPYILKNAVAKREAALNYLHDQNLGSDDRWSVVGIGHGEAIQQCLSKLLEKNIHGCYMVSGDKVRISEVCSDVLMAECFAGGEECTPEGLLSSSMPLRHYLLEKMVNPGGDLASNCGSAELRDGSDRGHSGQEIWREMQQGAIDFVKEAVRFRNEMLTSLRISKVHCEKIFSRFVSEMSDSEREIFKSIKI